MKLLDLITEEKMKGCYFQKIVKMLSIFCRGVHFWRFGLSGSDCSKNRERVKWGAPPIFIFFIVFLLFFNERVVAEYTDGALFRQNFESMRIGSNWSNEYLRVQEYTSGGIDGRILRATYVPTEFGSARIGKRIKLNKSETSATLSFDLKLHSQFEFVKGGKMHGLAGGSGTTGCKTIDPKGWSVRTVWKSGGRPILYIYHQDRSSACGDAFYPPGDFEFQRGKWYRVEVFVKMNTRVGSADGRAKLYIDGEKLIDIQNLNLSGNNNINIDTFLFSTFYGGSNDSWSPSKNTHAYFDNFTVYPGERISGDNGTACEIYKEGIYNKGNAVCCANSCGSCGGSGCGSLPGGGGNCCTGAILDSGRWCLSGDVSAPCAFYGSEPPPPPPSSGPPSPPPSYPEPPPCYPHSCQIP